MSHRVDMFSVVSSSLVLLLPRLPDLTNLITTLSALGSHAGLPTGIPHDVGTLLDVVLTTKQCIHLFQLDLLCFWHDEENKQLSNSAPILHLSTFLHFQLYSLEFSYPDSSMVEMFQP